MRVSSQAKCRTLVLVRGQAIAAFFVLTTLNIQAEQPRYRFIGTVPKPAYDLETQGGVRNGTAGYIGTPGGRLPGILSTPTGWTNLDETYGVQSARVNGVGDRVIGVSWRSSDGTDGYLYNGKLTKFKRSPNFLGKSVSLSGGGGDWVGGQIKFNEVDAGAFGNDDEIGSIAIGYNPVTDERVEFQQFYHNKFIASNPEGTMLFMSSQRWMSSPFDSGSHAMYTVRNGVTRYIGAGYAHDLNDNGDVLYSLGSDSMYIQDRFGNNRLVSPENPLGKGFTDGGQIDNAGRVLSRDSGSLTTYVSWGNRWYNLADCIEGGVNIGNPMLDPVTGYLYAGNGEIYAPVPEPGTLAALGVGLLLASRRRKRRA